MKHLSFFRPGLPAPTVKGPSSSTRRPRSARYSVLVGLLTVFVILPALFISTSSATSKLKSPFSTKPAAGAKGEQRKSVITRAASKGSTAVALNRLFPLTLQPVAPLIPQAPAPETMETFAADCTTPKTEFLLGETVCAKVTGAPGSSIQAFYWSNASNFLVQNSPILTATQEDTFVLPAANTSPIGVFTANNRGTWKITAAGIDDAVARAIAFITVTNPAEAAADLSVFKFTTSGESRVTEGTNVTFNLHVANVGPNAATNVTLTDSTPTNMTLVSLVENAGGAGFSCVGSVCTIASLPKDSSSSFTATYAVDNVAAETVSSYSASVASAIADPESPNDSATGEVTITVTGAATACTLICPQNINANANVTEGGIRGAHVTFPGAEPDGDCGAVTATPSSGSFFPVGTTTVSVGSETGGGSCTFTITVTDTGVDPPTISCPAAVEVTANNNCESVVNLGTPSTTGTNVTVSVTRSDGKPMYDCDVNGQNCVRKSQDLPFSTGITTVTWTATAHSSLPATEDNETGNASCTQTIIVNDVVAPTISAPPQTASADASCSAAVPDFTATATVADNCACASSDNSESCQEREPITITQSPAPGTIVGLGPHTITLTANDGSSNNNGAGNTATTTTTFTVNDTTAPLITLNGASTMTVECHTSFTDPGASASDACDTNVPVNVSGSVNVNVVGTYTLTYNAADDSGNPAAPVTRTVNVVDTTAPVITCPANVVVYLPANSNATSMAVNYAAPTATESCSTATVNSSPASGSVFPVGTTTVNATATDAAGNSSNCSFTVTVLYNFTGFFSPVANVPTLNSVNAGKAVPVKFSLSGDKGLNIFAAGNPYSTSLNCSTSDPGVDVTETLNAGGSSLSYTTDQYTYVWKTESSWVGTCRQLVLTLNDGTVHTAYFKFK